MPTPPGTKRNNGKRQEHADNCRNMQKSNATKNALIKTPIDNLQAAKCGFQPSLKTTWFSVLPFLLQYFDCLPTKLDTWCRHSIWKMISASRRIFWDGFQPFFKQKHDFRSRFFLQYFDCLPTKLDTWCRHSIRKMISASRRVFWHGFQPFLEKYRFSTSVF